MVIVTMRVTYNTIINVGDEFDFDPSLVARTNFRDATAGGWAPRKPSPDPLATSHASLRDGGQLGLAPSAAAARRREPWYSRNRAIQAVLNPLLLPTPMRLF